MLGTGWQPGSRVLNEELEEGWAGGIGDFVYRCGGAQGLEAQCESGLLRRGSFGELSLGLDFKGNYGSKLVDFQTRRRASWAKAQRLQ